MIRILDRLVISTFFKLFLMMLAASPPLFVIGDIAENLDDYMDRGLTRSEVAEAYFYQLPLFVQWSFPIAALLAAVFTVHSMTTHREIVAAKAGGISFHRLIAPLILSAVLLTGAALALSEVVPRSNRIAAQILRDENPGQLWRSDFVYQSEGGLTWQVDRLTTSDGRMLKVVLERRPTETTSGLHILAEAATYRPGEGWMLDKGYMRRLHPDSTEKTIEFDRMTMPEIVEKPEELLKAPREPDEMTYAEIDDLARIVARTGGNSDELLVRREQKIAIPVATLVIILFGAPLATSNKRGGAAYGIGLSLATVLIYIMMLRISGAFGSAGSLNPMVAAWLPNGVFMGAALVFLARVRT